MVSKNRCMAYDSSTQPKTTAAPPGASFLGPPLPYSFATSAPPPVFPMSMLPHSTYDVGESSSSTQPNNMMIPAKYLANMGEHSIKVDGVPVTVHVLDDPHLITYHIRKFEQSVLAADIQVVGVDYKMLKSGPPDSGKLILYTAGAGGGGGGGNIKVSFLSNDNICFVKNSNLDLDIGIEVGDLAARVLKNPALAQLRLGDIAREVGVPYVGLANGGGMTIELDKRNPLVMAEDVVF